MRILVVDDEPLVAQTVSMIFRKNGFEVETVYNAEEALQSARTKVPDLILCDIDMPGRDGVALMTDIGRELPKCPILVLTGLYGSLNRVRDCAQTLLQPVSIVIKPCQPSELLRTAGLMLKTA